MLSGHQLASISTPSWWRLAKPLIACFPVSLLSMSSSNRFQPPSVDRRFPSRSDVSNLLPFWTQRTIGTLPNAKMTELAIILAAYDEIGDQIVGVVEEYNFKEPEVLDRSKVQSLLDRAEVTVAHNC